MMMQTRNVLAALAVPALAVGLAAHAPAQEAEEQPTGLSVRIELKGNYYREGEPVEVRVNLENLTGKPYDNAEGIPIVGGLELELDGQPLRPPSPPAFDATTQPKVFATGSSITQIVDLAAAFPAARKAGKLSVRFNSGSIVSETVEVAIAPPYDPDLDYRARIKTDLGDIEMDLLEKDAPVHVQNFVDLARQGYFEGTHIFIVAEGEMIAAGSPEKDGSGGVEWGLPPELGNLPMERGMVFAVRTSFFDNANQFAISLGRNPDRDGRFTIFGKVIGGEETVESLEKVETTGNKRAPFFQPLEDTFVRAVVIETAPEEDAASADAASAEDAGK